MKRSDIVGLHRIKNKVSRNAFDLSHRHMFTAQIGELLPIFNTWVNPGDTLKLGYNGLSRTAPLQTAAFTRLKENVQYYFVPFQSLWKYFEQVVNNMTEGQSGENISMFASSPHDADKLGTSLPYIGYLDLEHIIEDQLNSCLDYIFDYYTTIQDSPADSVYDITYANYLGYLEAHQLVRNETLRYASICKLLNYLGYGNFPLMSYDVISSWDSYVKSLKILKMRLSAILSLPLTVGLFPIHIQILLICLFSLFWLIIRLLMTIIVILSGSLLSLGLVTSIILLLLPT